MVKRFPLNILFLVCLSSAACAIEIGTDKTAFTLNGKPTFLLGASYYAGLGAPDLVLHKDLDQLKSHGFNWIRVWITWAAFDHDVSAIDADGRIRPEFLARLKNLLGECDRRGLIVNLTLSRGNGVTGPSRLKTTADHQRAVENVVASLKAYSNWYLDLGNERNIRDARFVPIDELRRMRERVRVLDPSRLVTASHAGELSRSELEDYIQTIKVDFISLHRPRHTASPAETATRTKEIIQSIHNSGKIVPLHYDEPFRRAYGQWNPTADDFLLDFKNARDNGAAGWCFHNGDTRSAKDGRPRRSFDLREASLFDQLDAEESRFLSMLRP